MKFYQYIDTASNFKKKLAPKIWICSTDDCSSYDPLKNKKFQDKIEKCFF